MYTLLSVLQGENRLNILFFRIIAVFTGYCFLFSTLGQTVPADRQKDSPACLGPQLQISSDSLQATLTQVQPHGDTPTSLAQKPKEQPAEDYRRTLPDERKMPNGFIEVLLSPIILMVMVILLTASLGAGIWGWNRYYFKNDPEHRLKHSVSAIKHIQDNVKNMQQREKTRLAHLREITEEEQRAAATLLQLITDIKSFTAGDKDAMINEIPIKNKGVLLISDYLSVRQPASNLLTSVSPLHYFLIKKNHPFDLYLHEGPMESILKPYADDNLNVRVDKNFEGIILGDFSILYGWPVVLIVKLDDSLSPARRTQPTHAVIYHRSYKGKAAERNAGVGALAGLVGGTIVGWPWIGLIGGGAVGYVNKDEAIPNIVTVNIINKPADEINDYVGSQRALTLSQLKEIANGEYAPKIHKFMDYQLGFSALNSILTDGETMREVQAPLSELRQTITEAAPYLRITGDTVIKIVPEISLIDSAI